MNLGRYSIASPRKKVLFQVVSRGIKSNDQEVEVRRWGSRERQLTEEHKAKLKAAWAAKSPEERQFTEEHRANLKASLAARSKTEVEAWKRKRLKTLADNPDIAIESREKRSKTFAENPELERTRRKSMRKALMKKTCKVWWDDIHAFKFWLRRKRMAVNLTSKRMIIRKEKALWLERLVDKGKTWEEICDEIDRSWAEDEKRK